MMEQVVIAGSGPAGATAGIYAARAGLKPVILTGIQKGGQLTTTTDVENYPGFPEGITGPELMEQMIKQAERFGAEVQMEVISEAVKKGDVISVKTDQREIDTRSLVIATGSNPRKLGLSSEQSLAGRGVSYCATCDGFFFKDKIIAVVGGGDSALEEAQFLSRFGTKVYIIHRRDVFRGTKAMQERALSKDNIEPVFNSVVAEITGKDKLEGVILEDVNTGEKRELKVDGLFIAIGHIPNSKPFSNAVDVDEKGYIKVNDKMHTRTQGVFACGDVVDHYFMQAVTAAGMGCMAGIEAVKYIDELEGRGYPGGSEGGG